MTDLFGGYRSQSTKALASIQSDRYPDTNKDFEKNIQRLNEFVDYIASYLQTMQKGVDSANEDPITKIRQTVLDLGTLLGGGELLYGINPGDLRYFLPALSAMFGFDSSQPFPINLFYAVEHFFLGYIIPLDSWASSVNDVIQGWMTALGLDDAFKAAVQHLLTSFGNWTQELMAIFNNVVTLGGIFNFFDTTQNSALGEAWNQLADMWSQFTVANLGTVADPFLETLTPWIEAWANMVDVINDFLDIFTVGFGGDGMAKVSTWLTDLLHWLGDPVGMGTGNLSTAGGMGSIPILGPVLTWLDGFDPTHTVLAQMITAMGGTGSTLTDLGNTFAAAQMDWNAMVEAFSQGNYGGAQADFSSMISHLMSLFGSPDLLPTAGTFDPVSSATNMLESILVPAGAVASWTTMPNHQLTALAPGVLTNLLPDPTFGRADSLANNPYWVWDGTVDHTFLPGSGSAKTTANGSIRQLEGISIQCTPGLVIDVSCYTKWTGVVAAAGTAIALCVNAYDKNDNIISDPVNRVVASVQAPGTTSTGHAADVAHGASAADGNGWVKLTGAYTAPANTVYIAFCFEVESLVTTGNVWVDDCYCMMDIVDIGLITSSTDAYNNLVEETTQFWNWLTGAPTHPAVAPAAAVESAILPNIPAGTGPGESGDLLTHINNVASVNGGQGDPLSAALQSLQLLSNTVSDLSAKIQQQSTQNTGAGNSGRGFQIYFSNYGVWSNVPVNTTYGLIPGQVGSPGTGHFIIDNNGRAAWSPASNGDVAGICIFNGNGGQAYTNTVYQELQASLAGLPNGGNSRNFGLLRANAINNPTDYVFGDVFLQTDFTLHYEVGCYIGGVRHVWETGPVNTINLNFTFIAGVGNDPNRYQGYSGTQQVFDHVNIASDPGGVFPVDNNHRYWGFRSDTYNNGQNYPGPASYVGCADNAPPTVPGSGVRLYRTQTANVPENTTLNTVYSSWGDGTNRFFDAISEQSQDMTVLQNVLIGSFDSRTSTAGVAGVQVANAGRYNVAGRVDIGTSNCSAGAVSMCLVVQRFNSAGVLQEAKLMPQPAFFVNGFGGQYNTGFAGGSVSIGCQAGDILQLGHFLDPGTSGTGRNGAGTLSTLSFTGEITGSHTYMEVALANWSLN